VPGAPEAVLEAVIEGGEMWVEQEEPVKCEHSWTPTLGLELYTGHFTPAWHNPVKQALSLVWTRVLRLRQGTVWPRTCSKAVVAPNKNPRSTVAHYFYSASEAR
jgi:hypothetical protein